MTAHRTQLETEVPRLYATSPHPLPFAPALHIRSFLLQRPAGNLLLYGAPASEADRAAISELGGVERRYLNHQHEASFADDDGTPLFVHEADRDDAAAQLPVSGTFAERHKVGDDFEVIPIPGHTPGATAYLWDDGDHRFLFTGDTIFLRDGEWVAAVLDSSDRPAYLESLELLRTLEFDVLVPWAATGGQPYVAFTDRDDAGRRLEAIADRVRAGASG